MSNQEVVLVQRDGKVGIITLNRPEALNATNSQLSAELMAAINELEQDSDVHVLVITGAGDRAFSAGADIKQMAEREQEPRPEATRAGPPTHANQLLLGPKPVIAAINGVAVGGGALLASGADIRIGCERSRFRFIGVKAGRINSTWSLPHIVGLPKAKEFVFSARWIEADEALSVGLLNRLVPAAKLMEETLELAHTIAAHSPQVVQVAKQLFHDYVGMRLPDTPELEQKTTGDRIGAPPFAEAFKDFLNTRTS